MNHDELLEIYRATRHDPIVRSEAVNAIVARNLADLEPDPVCASWVPAPDWNKPSAGYPNHWRRPVEAPQGAPIDGAVLEIFALSRHDPLLMWSEATDNLNREQRRELRALEREAA